VQFRAIADGLEFAGLFHDLIPRQLALRLCPRLFRRIPAGQFVKVRRVTANLRTAGSAYSRRLVVGRKLNPVGPLGPLPLGRHAGKR